MAPIVVCLNLFSYKHTTFRILKQLSILPCLCSPCWNFDSVTFSFWRTLCLILNLFFVPNRFLPNGKNICLLKREHFQKAYSLQNILMNNQLWAYNEKMCLVRLATRCSNTITRSAPPSVAVSQKTTMSTCSSGSSHSMSNGVLQLARLLSRRRLAKSLLRRFVLGRWQ